MIVLWMLVSGFTHFNFVCCVAAEVSLEPSADALLSRRPWLPLIGCVVLFCSCGEFLPLTAIAGMVMGKFALSCVWPFCFSFQLRGALSAEEGVAPRLLPLRKKERERERE